MSFVRNPNFTRNQEKRSTGIPDLDKIVGGGLRLGEMSLILEDENSHIHTVLLKTFLTEGIFQNEKVLGISKETDSIEQYKINTVEDSKDNHEKMVIAWRYSNLTSTDFKFRYDLSSRAEFTGMQLTGDQATFEEIIQILQREKGLRVAIFSLLSPLWRDENLTQLRVITFLHKLRKYVKLNEHICLVSIPAFLFSGMFFNLYFDKVFEIDSHLFSGFCPNYKGIIELVKSSNYRNFRVNELSSAKFGVKIKKNRIVIESIDIPPEDVKPASTGCAPETQF